MRGRPFEVAWREEDTPEALKAGYQRVSEGIRRNETLKSELGCTVSGCYDVAGAWEW
jgi:hypothetical protein